MNFGSKVDLSKRLWLLQRASMFFAFEDTQYAPLRLYVSSQNSFFKRLPPPFSSPIRNYPDIRLKIPSKCVMGGGVAITPVMTILSSLIAYPQTNPNHRSMPTEQILNAREHMVVLSGHAASHLSWKCLIGH